MKVALINPPHPYLIKPDSQAPLGLMYLASVLRVNGHEASIVNLSRYGEHEARLHVPLDADLYGFTATCIDYPTCERLAARMREWLAKAPIVIGGPHPTVAAKYVNLAVFDSMCVGEGEDVILQMVADVSRGQLRKQYRADRVRNLDAVPFPARDLMDQIGGDVFAKGQHYSGTVSSVIITARGCPFDCAFCGSGRIWERSVTKRSVDSVLEEVRQVRDTYGIREFRFSDDTMNASRPRLTTLCHGLRKLDVFWRCSVRAGISDPDVFQMMFDSGCREVSPGIESGDQRVLDFLDKGTTVEANRKLIESATRAGINVRVLLMSGTPGEHADTPEVNRAFLHSLDYNLVSVTQFRPIPGSAIWERPEHFGCRILNRDLEHYNFYFWHRGDDGRAVPTPIEAVIDTDLLSRQQLEDNMARMRQYALETGKCNTG
jgi:radical SAM superfamily enzyme YgiQ (UPF0313 family)